MILKIFSAPLGTFQPASGRQRRRVLPTGLAMIALLFGLLNVQAAEEPLDRVVAVVDDDIVLQSELDERITLIRERLAAENTPAPPYSVLEERMLEQLILENLQLQLADRAGMRVSDSELNQTMASIASQNGLTLPEFQEQLASEGISYESARDQVKREMLISRLQQRLVDSRIRVTEKEVEDYLSSAQGRASNDRQYRIGHILLASGVGEVERREALERAREFIRQIREGTPFAQLAVAHSDASTAMNGGDLGWRKGNELPTLFADVVPSLEVGEVAEPLETDGGVHIVTLLDRQGGANTVVEQSLVRHILVQTNALRSELEAEELIESLYQQVMAGEDFAELARAYSDDAVSGAAGGSLNWVSPGEMVPAFEAKVNETAVGDVSRPFQSQFGWHILRVEDRRKEDIGDRLKSSQARQILHRRKYQEELENWLSEIRDEAFVQLKR